MRGTRRGDAEAHGNAEALRGSDADVGAPLAGRHEGREREEIGGGDNLGAGGVSGDDAAKIAELQHQLAQYRKINSELYAIAAQSSLQRSLQ